MKSEMTEYKKVIIPAVITMFFMSIYTTVDGLFVSHVMNTDALAAINICYPIVNIMFAFAFGLGSGSSVQIAYAKGMGHKDKANEIFTLVILAAVIVSILCIGIMGIAFQPLLNGLGATQKTIGYCRVYGATALLFFPVGIIKEILAFVLRVEGMPAISMLSSILGGVANIVLDYFFIVCLDYGILGAAVATGLGMTLSLLVNIYFLIKKGELRLCRTFVFHKNELIDLIRLSLSGGILELSYAVVTWNFNRYALACHKEDGVAAYTVIGYIQYAMASVFLGITNGVTPLLSFRHGAGEKIAGPVGYIYRFTIICGAVITMLTFCGAEAMAGIFVKKGTAPFLLAVTGIKVIAFSYLFMGINVFATGMLNICGEGRKAAIITFLRTVAFLLLGGAILTYLMGYEGMWMSYITTEIMAAIIIRILHIKRKENYE